jgi:hypothetical protein
MEWKDDTSYSRSDAERVPRSWVIEAGGFKLSVHRHIYHAPDAWLLTCHPWFECHALPSKAAPMAKQQALELVRKRLAAALVDLGA